MNRRRVVLVQLPIPQPGLEPARGNVPLAAAYLQLYARSRRLDAAYDIEILPSAVANRAGDRGLVEAIAAREPWLVGFTCYLWNVERSLWVAEQLKRTRPDLRVLVGGPEITADNAWVLQSPAVDFAAVGEGEQTFADLLDALRIAELPAAPIPGLWITPQALATTGAGAADPVLVARRPAFRTPLAQLDAISSPYLSGILDAADESLLLLETIRGCIFKCKFCFYPKSYDDLYFLSEDKIVANLRHATEHGAREVILLDPTLNQRRDFAGFVRLLGDCNPEHRFTYFGELRAEGIDREIATLLRAANFTEVEIGLQSTDPVTQKLMDRRNNMRAFERGVGAMLQAGIRVKIDLIVGLPGDTPESVRQSIDWVRESGLYSDVQVFTLAVLPGTAFREEATQLGLVHQPRPPYYVLQTPALRTEDLYELVAAAEETFELEFDDVPPPRLPERCENGGPVREWIVDVDGSGPAVPPVPPPAGRRAQAFTLRLQGRDLPAHRQACTSAVATLLADNPHTTLQVVLEPTGDVEAITPSLLDALAAACYARPTYLDRFYAVLPGVPKGGKRLVVRAAATSRRTVSEDWIDAVTERAAILWTGADVAASDLFEQEFVACTDRDA